jgi:hypothetical protein
MPWPYLAICYIVWAALTRPGGGGWLRAVTPAVSE